MPAVDASNPILGLIAIAATGFVTFLVTKFTDRNKSINAAASREITVRAELVTHMSARIRELEERLDGAIRRERELIERYRVDTDAIEGRYRHLTNSLVMHTALLRRALLREGIEPPEFGGFERFVEEGGLVGEGWSETMNTDAIAATPRPAGAAVILVVEDEEAQARTFKRQFEAAGYGVEIAKSGHLALRLASAISPDLVVVDLLLPDMDGFEVAARLRKEEFAGPIIAVSGMAHLVDKGKIAENGIAEMFTKPIRGRVLLDAIARHLRAAGAAESC